jgi:hypothetical protein
MAVVENASYINPDHTNWDATIDGVHWGGAVDGTLWDVIVESEVEITAYAVPAMTWGEVRAERNQLLAGTDFRALSDVPMSDEMTAYRQALRDVPADNADPDDISWPSKP